MENKIIELTDYLNKCRDEYYNQSEPTLSDVEYDKMFDNLASLEKEHSFSLFNSPTKTVGCTVVSQLNKYTHKTALLSLDKTKLVSDIVKFMSDKILIAMLKLDGLTLCLEYNNGELIKGSTRGDGYVGSDVTFHMCKFKNVPMYIGYKGYLKVSGEAIIHQDDFDRINSKLADEGKYKTRRNLASGTLGSLDNKITEERCLYFYAYNLLENDITANKSDELRILKQLEFDVVGWVTIYGKSTIQNEINLLNEFALEKGIPIDGIVFTQNNIEYGLSLGSTNHHPLHSIAYKFPDIGVKTILTDVIWQVGRTGKITPVAIFDEVIIDNTEVRQASVHNVSILQKLELGIGDTISIIKSNMIIPQISENLTRSNTLIIPTVCPICDMPTTIRQDKDSKVLMCINSECSGQLLTKLNHFVSKNGMDIDGLSKATLEFLLEKGWINNFYDIYNLKSYKEEWSKCDGFGEKSVNKILNTIKESQNVKLENFIVALGIPNIGRTASKTISKYFKGKWLEFEQAIYDKFDFTVLEDFGYTMNDNIMNWHEIFATSQDIKLIYSLDFIVDKVKSLETTSKCLTGLSFVITGKLNAFTNRDEATNEIILNDGKVIGSVSSKCNYLVNNDISSTSGKNKSAKELGIPIISENELIKMMRED